MSVELPFKIYKSSKGNQTTIHVRSLLGHCFNDGEIWMGEFKDNDTLILRRKKTEEVENVPRS